MCTHRCDVCARGLHVFHERLFATNLFSPLTIHLNEILQMSVAVGGSVEAERRTRAARSNPTSWVWLKYTIVSGNRFRADLESWIMCRLIESVFCRWSDTKLPSTRKPFTCFALRLVACALFEIR